MDDQIYALNLARADFDNVGQLDVVLLRGGWERPMRLSLLRNTGSGAFEDVTIASGLAEPIAAESAVWGDIDNNGSFGGNRLVESLGLLDATAVAELEIFWPTSQTTQSFRDIAADQAIEITEGMDSFKPLPQPWVGDKSSIESLSISLARGNAP